MTKSNIIFVSLITLIGCKEHQKQQPKEQTTKLVNLKQEQISLFRAKAQRAVNQGDTAEAVKYFKLCLDIDKNDDAGMKEFIEYSLNQLKLK